MHYICFLLQRNQVSIEIYTFDFPENTGAKERYRDQQFYAIPLMIWLVEFPAHRFEEGNKLSSTIYV